LSKLTPRLTYNAIDMSGHVGLYKPDRTPSLLCADQGY
jgi:hypothetical protein